VPVPSLAKVLLVGLRQPEFSHKFPPQKLKRYRLSFLLHPHITIVMTALNGVNGTICNAEQYQQSLSSYNNSNSSISCLTCGESISLAVSICLCQVVLKFTLHAAECQGIVPQFYLCSRHVYIRKTPNLLFVTFSCFFMLFSKKAEKV